MRAKKDQVRAGKTPHWKYRQKCYNAGWKAHSKGESLDTNPNTEGTVEYVEWRRGWGAKERQVALMGPPQRKRSKA